MSGTLIVERARQAISRLSDADAPWPAVAGEMMTRLRRVVGFGAFRAAQNDPRAPMPAAALADNDAVDADGDPELLWALRGGGAFGVVTSLTLAVHPVPDVRTAAVMLPVDRARDGLVAYRETCAGADGRAGLPGLGPGQRRRSRPGRRRRALVDAAENAPGCG